jgi:hypothetical protein
MKLGVEKAEMEIGPRSRRYKRTGANRNEQKKTDARNNDLVGRLQLRAKEKSAATNRPTTNEKPKLEQEKRTTKISDPATPKIPQHN